MVETPRTAKILRVCQLQTQNIGDVVNERKKSLSHKRLPSWQAPAAKRHVVYINIDKKKRKKDGCQLV